MRGSGIQNKAEVTRGTKAGALDVWVLFFSFYFSKGFQNTGPITALAGRPEVIISEQKPRGKITVADYRWLPGLSGEKLNSLLSGTRVGPVTARGSK